MLSFSSIFIVCFLLYLIYVYFNQQNMVFRASGLPKNHVFSFSNHFDEVYSKTNDGTKLHGLLFPIENSKGLILYFHGNKGNVDLWGRDAVFYNSLGYDVFYTDYRGFGKSEGQVEDEAQIFEDALVIFDDTQKRFKPQKMIVLGYSIGTGVATYVANQRKVQALILLAPFYNFTEFTASRVPFFPNSWKKFSFETNRYIKTVPCPIFIFHGDRDYVIPIQNSIKLRKFLKPADRFFTLPNEGHFGINQNPDFQKIISGLNF